MKGVVSQKACSDSFQLSGSLKGPSSSDEDTDFSSRIGGYNDGEILFVYENFEGEMGVCRGVVPSDKSNEFEVHCTDLVGFDKNNSTKGTLKFEKILEE